MAKRVWKIREIEEFFTEPRLNSINNRYYDVRKIKLSCGHITIDPAESYANETSFQMQRLMNLFDMQEGKRPKARCYECGRIAQEAKLNEN